MPQEPKTVAQPLNRGAGDEHAALERIRRAAADPPRNRREEPPRRGHPRGSRVEQHEASGAIGILGRAGRVARLPEKRRLLVARDPGDRHAAREPAEVRGVAEGARGTENRRQHGARDPEELQHLVVPVPRLEVQAERSRGVARVRGVHAATGELPEEPRVHRAECQLAALGSGARARDRIEEPADLGAGEVGVEDEPGAFLHKRLDPLGAQAVTDRRRPSALPDDRAVDGRSRCTIPEDGRLALVGDPDRRHLGATDARLRERGPRRALDRRPDLLGIVLDPARLREILRQLGVAAGEDAAVGIDDQRRRASRALVEGENVAARGHLFIGCREPEANGRWPEKGATRPFIGRREPGANGWVARERCDAAIGSRAALRGRGGGRSSGGGRPQGRHQDEDGAFHGARPSTRLATSGRSGVRTSTPSSTRRRIARPRFTAPTPRSKPAARAALTTAASTSVYWRPASVAPAATAHATASSGRPPACPTWWAETRSAVRWSGTCARIVATTSGLNAMMVERDRNPAPRSDATSRSSSPS